MPPRWQTGALLVFLQLGLFTAADAWALQLNPSQDATQDAAQDAEQAAANKPAATGETQGVAKMQDAQATAPLQGSLSLIEVSAEYQRWQLDVSHSGNGSISAHFRSGMSADLKLSGANGERIWAWSDEMMFTQALREETISAGSSLQFRFDVPRRLLDGCGGECRLTAVFAGRSADGQELMLPTVISL